MLGSRFVRLMFPLVFLGACSGGATGDAGSTAEFASILQQVPPSWDPVATPQELADQVSLTILGTIVSVSKGIDYFVTGDREPVFSSVILDVQVEEVLAGEGAVASDVVKVLILSSPSTPTSAFEQAVPQDQHGIFFLSPMTAMFGDDGFREFPKGLDERSVLWSPHPQGMILEDTLTQRLTGGEISNDEFPAGWDLETATAEFAAALRHDGDGDGDGATLDADEATSPTAP